MREILFRGKRIDNGEWVEGYLLFDEEHNEAYIAEHFEDKAAYLRKVIPETVGQYTGYENNGNKIFEGDIVRTQRGKFYEIKLYKGAWVVWSEKAKLDIEKWDFLNTFSPTVEVNGNIHDNPELLKGGEAE